MARARKGTAIQSKLGFLIYGVQGTWKSSLCLEFTKYKREDGEPFKVLYIDGEIGSIDDYIDKMIAQGVDPNNLLIIYTQSLGETMEYIRKAANNEDFMELDDDGNETSVVVTDASGKPFRPDAIVVDGTSVIYKTTQQGLIEFSKKRATVRAKKNELTGIERTVAVESANLEIKDYGTLAMKGQELILGLNASGKHWAVTAREEDEKEQVKSGDSFQSVATGRKKPEGFKNMAHNAKTVLHTIMTDEGEVQAIVDSKDRSGVHDQNKVLSNPTLMDWEAVIQRNKDRADFTPANLLSDSIRIEQEIYEKEVLSNDKSKQTVTSAAAANGEKTIEQYHAEIKATIGAMDATMKKTLKSQLTSAGLPTKYQEVEDIEVLQKILDVIRNKH